MLSQRFYKALSIAAELHSSQIRKGTTIPYVSHVLGVASIALQFGADEDQAIAALFHDTIEDAPLQMGAEGVRKLIRFFFGEGILGIVEGCTDADVTPKPRWRIRKEQYIHKLSRESKSVLLVSASDKLHNATAILWDFRKDGDHLWKRFNEEAGKEGTIGYYRGLVNAYKSTGHHEQLISELDRVVSQIEEEAKHKGMWPLQEAPNQKSS